MKKSIRILLGAILLTSYGKAQDTIQKPAAKKHLNELGLDMTQFIKFYANFSQYDSYYQPSYFVTYRRYFKKSNFRSAIGGNYTYSENPSPLNGDSLNKKYYDRAKSIIVRVGYEFFQDLSSRWQVYYGGDVFMNYSHEKNDAPYWNGGYANGLISETKAFGIAPVLGVRFRLSKRVSVITESTFLVQYSENSSSHYYLPVSSSFPPIPDTKKATSKAFGTSFNYPISLILTLNI